MFYHRFLNSLHSDAEKNHNYIYNKRIPHKHEAEDDFNYLIEQYFNHQIDPDRFYLFESTEDLLNDERLIKNLEAVAQESNFSSDSESEDEDIFDIEE